MTNKKDDKHPAPKHEPKPVHVEHVKAEKPEHVEKPHKAEPERSSSKYD